jgi:CRISPR-associated protein Csx10
MKQIQLTITALSPLAIGRKKPGSVSEAGDYIPGSVIRGAVAAVMLKQSGRQNADLSEAGGDFQALFLNEDAAIFRNAYPASTEDVSVLPATAVSSKTNPGFKPKGNGVFDTLIDRFCAEGYNHPYDPSCPKALGEGTDGRVEPFSGFYSKTNGKYTSHPVTKRLLTRVGINRRRATAEEEILYSIEVLSEGKDKKAAIYRSSILVRDDNLADLTAGFINSHTFRLGGAASRGLGKVEIEANAIKPETDIASRIHQFNETLQQRWQKWGELFGNFPLENRTYFTLDLQADAILTDNWRRTTVICPRILQNFGSINDSSLELHVAYSSYDYASGWNSAWGLMKDVDLITNKGGVYLFSTTKDRQNEWIEALKKLEMEGVGDLTCEGFGQIQVCNEFHTVFREGAV